MNKNLSICKSNEIVESSYTLTLNEQRVLLSCIAQIDSRKTLSVTDEFTLKAEDFAKVFGVSADRAYSELQAVTKQLFERKTSISSPLNEIDRVDIRWVSSVAYSSKRGEITLQFSQKIIPYLSEIKTRFTAYPLGCVAGMKSVYGIRLYELLKQYESIGKREFALEELKRIFEVSENYKDKSNDFKRFVIEPAVKNINKHSDLSVEVGYSKTGRAVTGVIFTFKTKTAEKPAKKATVAREKKSNGIAAPVAEKSLHDELAARFGKSVADDAIAKSEGMTPKEAAAVLVGLTNRMKV